MATLFALVPGQTLPFLPVWLTPIWILALGTAAGLIASAILYAVLGGLSAIPALGQLADCRRRATIAASVIAATVAIAGILRFVVFIPENSAFSSDLSERHTGFLVLPWICLGAVVGWAWSMAVWRRTIREIIQISSEGVLGIVLAVLAGFSVLGLCATPIIDDRAEILGSLTDVLQKERWETTVTLDAAPADLTADQAPFQQRTGFNYDSDRMTEVTVASNRTIMIANAATPENLR